MVSITTKFFLFGISLTKASKWLISIHDDFMTSHEFWGGGGGVLKLRMSEIAYLKFKSSV